VSREVFQLTRSLLRGINPGENILHVPCLGTKVWWPHRGYTLHCLKLPIYELEI